LDVKFGNPMPLHKAAKEVAYLLSSNRHWSWGLQILNRRAFWTIKKLGRRGSEQFWEHDDGRSRFSGMNE
jgi:hypothetical protein